MPSLKHLGILPIILEPYDHVVNIDIFRDISFFSSSHAPS